MWHMKTIVIPVVVGTLGNSKEGDDRKHRESIQEG